MSVQSLMSFLYIFFFYCYCCCCCCCCSHFVNALPVFFRDRDYCLLKFSVIHSHSNQNGTNKTMNKKKMNWTWRDVIYLIFNTGQKKNNIKTVLNTECGFQMDKYLLVFKSKRKSNKDSWEMFVHFNKQ